MDAIKIKLAFVVDVGSMVSLFGFHPVTGEPTAIYVDQRPWTAALQRARQSTDAVAFIAKGLTVSLDFDLSAEPAEVVQ